MKEGADFSGVTHYTQVDVQPGGINIQHVENLYQADILKQLGIELEVKGKGEPAAAADELEVKGKGEPAAAADEQTELTERLKPVFYNNEGDVRQFLKEIAGMTNNDITDLVNKWVKAKRISNYGNSRKGVLWEILNDAGLYTRSRQNWCRRVD